MEAELLRLLKAAVDAFEKSIAKDEVGYAGSGERLRQTAIEAVHNFIRLSTTITANHKAAPSAHAEER